MYIHKIFCIFQENHHSYQTAWFLAGSSLFLGSWLLWMSSSIAVEILLRVVEYEHPERWPCNLCADQLITHFRWIHGSRRNAEVSGTWLGSIHSRFIITNHNSKYNKIQNKVEKKKPKVIQIDQSRIQWLRTYATNSKWQDIALCVCVTITENNKLIESSICVLTVFSFKQLTEDLTVKLLMPSKQQKAIKKRYQSSSRLLSKMSLGNDS